MQRYYDGLTISYLNSLVLSWYVESQVFIIVSLLSESFTAMSSLVRLLSSVSSHMINEVPCFIEFSVAIVVLANKVSENSACFLVMTIWSLKIIVPHWSNVSFLDIVILRRTWDPLWIRVFSLYASWSNILSIAKLS